MKEEKRSKIDLGDRNRWASPGRADPCCYCLKPALSLGL